MVEVDLVTVTEHEDGHVTALRDLAQQLLLQPRSLFSAKGGVVRKKFQKIVLKGIVSRDEYFFEGP